MKRTLGVNLWRKVTAVDGQHSWNMTLCIKQVCVWNVKESVLQHVCVRLHLRWGLRLMHAHVSYTHTNTRERRCLKLQAASAPFPSYAARLSASKHVVMKLLWAQTVNYNELKKLSSS